MVTHEESYCLRQGKRGQEGGHGPGGQNYSVHPGLPGDTLDMLCVRNGGHTTDLKVGAEFD